jgi:hypothetical protein
LKGNRQSCFSHSSGIQAGTAKRVSEEANRQ